MTDNQFHRLDLALDDCNDRLSQAMVILGDMQTRVRELSIERDALSRAKALVSPQPDTAAPPAPAQAAEKRDTLAECIAAIRERHGDIVAIQMSDRNMAAVLKGFGHKFNIRTVRNALAEIGKSSRAGDSSLSPQEEPENPPVDGASLVRETDPGPMPDFLKRNGHAEAGAK